MTPDDARRVLLGELERARFDASHVPPVVLDAVVERIVSGASTVAHGVEFLQALAECKTAQSRGEINHDLARQIMRQLMERQRGERLGD